MRKLLFTVFTAMTLMFSSSQVLAATSANFSVKAEISDNQVDRSNPHFDLRIKPDQKQMIRVEIRNNSENPITASVTLNPATTGANGIILYNAPACESEGDQLSIMDVARVDTPEVNVDAASVATAEITIEMPKEGIEGAILGGLVFSAKNNTAESSQNTSARISLQNVIDYVIALKLTESDTIVSPDFTLAVLRRDRRIIEPSSWQLLKILTPPL